MLLVMVFGPSSPGSILDYERTAMVPPPVYTEVPPKKLTSLAEASAGTGEVAISTPAVNLPRGCLIHHNTSMQRAGSDIEFITF